jgi:pimeloyl-ACP methyl ester carboxylesterase
MPLLSRGPLTIEYADEGAGPPVLLIHSSVSSNRQWRSLTEALKDRYRVLAVNLFGYGETTPWPGITTQTLYAQAQLVLALCEELQGSLHLVGHSLGGSVALKAALLLGERAQSMVLLEPNPFSLLRQSGRTRSFLEIHALRDHVQCFGALGDWPRAAAPFADYWLGDGSWAAMPERRRAAFAASLPPVLHEWDAVLGEETPMAVWQALTPRTLVVSDDATRAPIREIVELFAAACPHWSFHRLPEGGHMAPLTRPDLVNPVVRAFLDGGAERS